MNKTLIIIGREFSTRVRKKSFLVLTLVVPVLMAGFYAFLMWMLLKDDTQERKIAVINRSELQSPLERINNTVFEYVDTVVAEEEVSDFLKQSDYYAVVWISEAVMEQPEVPVYSFSQVPMELKNEIASQLRKMIEDIKRATVIEEAQVPELEEKLAASQTPVQVRTLKVSEETGEAKESSSEIASALGVIAGMVIYLFIFMYASQVMKGVIEEKTNRIIEVLVSSVKPFQFLLGKIVGVAAVGLVQFLIWVVCGVVLIVAMQAFFLPGLDLDALRQAGSTFSDIGGTQLTGEQLAIVQKLAMTIEPFFMLKFLAAFLFYFIGGYLLYASLFAAIGAAVDNETDSQQFLTPLSIVLVLGLYIGFAAMKSPESPLVFWSSLIPFTSPIVMLVRMPFGVPGWELLCSLLLLVASFIFFTWLSGRIYRVGILMYGKKVTWKELYKWLKY
ncbi:MAG: ABC transporter permease [Odoribacter sp.]|nr:ABC transporter permease [Odoribacter sp.]